MLFIQVFDRPGRIRCDRPETRNDRLLGLCYLLGQRPDFLSLQREKHHEFQQIYEDE